MKNTVGMPQPIATSMKLQFRGFNASKFITACAKSCVHIRLGRNGLASSNTSHPNPKVTTAVRQQNNTIATGIPKTAPTAFTALVIVFI